MNDSGDAPLGLVLSTVTAGGPREFIDVARTAEARGFAAVLVNEGRGDALACAQAIASATARVTVGTNIANIYFRHPFLAAASARAIVELVGPRLVLGFGISHRALLARLGIDMGDARTRLRDYVRQVKEALAGTAGSGFLQAPRSPHPVTVLAAANTVETAAIAGAEGDGLMPYLTPVDHVPLLIAAARAAAGSERAGSLDCIMSVPTFLHDDEAQARSAARYNLAFFAVLPNYRRQWRRAGFGQAMDAIRALGPEATRTAIAPLIPDELIDAVCIVGNAARCRTQLARCRRAGVRLPLLAVSPVNEERHQATVRVIDRLAPRSG